MTGRRGSSFSLGLVLLGGLLGLVLVAPLLVAGDSSAQPDSTGGYHLPPLTRVSVLTLADGSTLYASALTVQGDSFEIERGGARSSLPRAAVRNLGADGLPPSRRFLLGTDRFGRDLWVRLWEGGRASLLVAALATALAVAIGVGVGALAALGGALTDSLLMRTVDGLLAFPRLFLLLAVAALWGPGGGERGLTSLLVTAFLLGASSWMDLARLVRGELISLRERDFVLAARVTGCRTARLLLRHLLPNLVPLLLADAALRLGDAILLEAALGFLGLGVQPPTASWGTLLVEGREVVFQAWWTAVFPGLVVTAAVLGCGLLADGLSDRLRRQGA